MHQAQHFFSRAASQPRPGTAAAHEPPPLFRPFPLRCLDGNSEAKALAHPLGLQASRPMAPCAPRRVARKPQSEKAKAAKRVKKLHVPCKNIDRFAILQHDSKTSLRRGCREERSALNCLGGAGLLAATDSSSSGQRACPRRLLPFRKQLCRVSTRYRASLPIPGAEPVHVDRHTLVLPSGQNTHRQSLPVSSAAPCLRFRRPSLGHLPITVEGNVVLTLS